MQPTPDAPTLAAADGVISRALDELEPELLRRTGTATTTAKQDGTPVTQADMLADRTLTAAIHDAFDGHAVLSEEADTTWRSTEWTWIIDPIDGTSNFAAGLPYWAISVALAHQGTPVYACVAAPALGERFTATTGGGAYLHTRDAEAQQIQVMDPPDFRSGRFSHVPIAVSSGTLRRIRRGAVRLNARIMGAWALDLAFVAAGRLAGSYARVPHVWDIAAGTLLITEAGGAVRQVGKPLLPLRDGVDYVRASAPLATGPDGAWLDALMGELPD